MLDGPGGQKDRLADSRRSLTECISEETQERVGRKLPCAESGIVVVLIEKPRLHRAFEGAALTTAPMEKGEQSVYADGVGRDAGRYKLSH